MSIGALSHIDQRGTHSELIIELVFYIYPNEAATLPTEDKVILHRYLYRKVGVLYSGVYDLYSTLLVIDRIVDTFLKDTSPHGYPYRATRYIVGPQGDTTPSLGLIAPLEGELIALGILQGLGLNISIERAEYIFLLIGIPSSRAWLIGCRVEIAASPTELVIEVFPKRFYLGKDNLPIFGIYGDAIDKVKEAIASILWVIVGIEPIEVEELKEDFSGKLSVPGSLIYRSNIVDRSGIIIEDVHAEVIRIDLYRIERIDVLHHQIPDRIPSDQAVTLEHLEHQTVIGDFVLSSYIHIGSGRNPVVGKLPYLIHLSFVGILVSDRQDFIIIQSLT